MTARIVAVIIDGLSCHASIDPERRRVQSKCAGVVTFAEAIAYQAELRREPAFDPAFDHILDLSGVEDIALTSDEIRNIALRSIFAHSSRRAIVAPDRMLFGVGRMYGTYLEVSGVPSPHVRVFESMDAALEWLERGEE